MANKWQASSQGGLVDLQISGLPLLRTASQCMPTLPAMPKIILTGSSPMAAYNQNIMAGCACLNHWGSAQSSDLVTSQIRVLQPYQTCSPPGLEDFPSCRAQGFENDMIDCDCATWLEDNAFEPYQDNNPCLGYPIPTTAPATCSYT